MRSFPAAGDGDLSRLLTEQVIKLSDRGFGGAPMQSNLASSQRSLTLARGARNLMDKARRHLAAGREERADSCIDRALDLPRNDFMEAPTAL